MALFKCFPGFLKTPSAGVEHCEQVVDWYRNPNPGAHFWRPGMCIYIYIYPVGPWAGLPCPL